MQILLSSLWLGGILEHGNVVGIIDVDKQTIDDEVVKKCIDFYVDNDSSVAHDDIVANKEFLKRCPCKHNNQGFIIYVDEWVVIGSILPSRD